MSDGKTDDQEAERINVDDPCDLADWTTKLGYNADRIRDAVRRVGPRASHVLKQLRRDPAMPEVDSARNGEHKAR